MYQIVKTYFTIFKLVLLEKNAGARSQMVLDPCESNLDLLSSIYRGLIENF